MYRIYIDILYEYCKYYGIICICYIIKYHIIFYYIILCYIHSMVYITDVNYLLMGQAKKSETCVLSSIKYIL